MQRFVDGSRLILNPDCGFAPAHDNPISLDEAYLKLRSVSAAAAKLRPDVIAVSREDRAFTFAELERRASAIAVVLGSFGRGVYVAVAVASGPEFTAVQLACLKAGVLFAAMPEQATEREARCHLAPGNPRPRIAHGRSRRGLPHRGIGGDLSSHESCREAIRPEGRRRRQPQGSGPDWTPASP